jgi:hypothetical protein
VHKLNTPLNTFTVLAHVQTVGSQSTQERRVFFSKKCCSSRSYQGQNNLLFQVRTRRGARERKGITVERTSPGRKSSLPSMCERTGHRASRVCPRSRSTGGAAKRAAGSAAAAAWEMVASASEWRPSAADSDDRPPPPPLPLLSPQPPSPSAPSPLSIALVAWSTGSGSGGLGCQASVVVRPTVAWCQRPTLRGRGKSAWPRQRCHCCCCRCCYLDHQCYCCCHHCCYCSCWSQ